MNVNPSIVSDMVVVSSIPVTLNTYSHVLPSMRENAVYVFEAALK